jgi:hypothetical protein
MTAPVAVVQRLVVLRLAAELAVNRLVELRLAAVELRLAAAVRLAAEEPAVDRRSAKETTTVKERCASLASVRGRRLRRLPPM